MIRAMDARSAEDEDRDIFFSANQQILQSYHDRAMDAQSAEDEESSSLQTAYDRNTMAVEDLGHIS
jgi:hypothetical protein